jgi:alpha/beta superfamily hydrolase
MQASMKVEDIGQESPVFIQAGQASLSAIVGVPTHDRNGPGVVVLAGGWRGTSAGRNRVMVRLSRRMMASGFQTLRFDYAGVGESSGSQKRRLADPSVEDLLAAVRWFQAHGPAQIVLAGFCYGGWTALVGAPLIQRLDGIALLAVPVNVTGPSELALASDRVRFSRLARQALRPWFLKRMFDADRRRLYRRYLQGKWQAARRGKTPAREAPSQGEMEPSSRFVDLLDSLVERSVPVLLLYGTEDFMYDEFQRARVGGLGEIVERGGSSIEVCAVPGYVHPLAELDVQESLIEAVAGWVNKLHPTGAKSEEQGWTSVGPTSNERSGNR